MKLEWKTERRVDGLTAVSARVATNQHYYVRRRLKHARYFLVMFRGAPLCEAPDLASGKMLAERHANGDWK